MSKPPIYTIHPRWVCRKGVRVAAMCSEASCSFLTKQTDVTYVLNIPPQRHKVLEPAPSKPLMESWRISGLLSKSNRVCFARIGQLLICVQVSLQLYTQMQTLQERKQHLWPLAPFKNAHWAENDRPATFGFSAWWFRVWLLVPEN